MRGGLGSISGWPSHQIPVNLRMGLECRVKPREFPEYLSLPCRRIRPKRTIPVSKRIGIPGGVVVVAKMGTKKNVDESCAQFPHSDMGLSTQMDRLQRLKESLAGTRSNVVSI